MSSKIRRSAAAIGTMEFLAYFFTLFMRPSLEELPAYCVIAVGAVAAQLIARVVLRRLALTPGSTPLSAARRSTARHATGRRLP
jgi:hypothetical protein